MIYLPLFGKDSEPHSSSRVIGLAATFGFWFILFIVVAVINPRKPVSTPEIKFETVQLVLSPEDHYIPTPKDVSLGAEEVPLEFDDAPADSSPMPVDTVPDPVQTVPVQQPKPVSPVKSETPVKNSTPVKNGTQSTTTTTSAPRPSETYATSVEDMMSAQLNGTKKAAVWDDSLFQDTTKATTNNPSTVNKVVDQTSSFSGSAATAANVNETVQSSSKKTSSPEIDTKVSDSTSSALNNIVNTKPSNFSSSTNGTKSISSLNTSKDSTGKVSIQMSDGSARLLLEPSSPSIHLSELAAAAIDGNRSVKISFRVVESGNVPRGDIVITPESVLPLVVRQEIIDQLSKWRFEASSNIAKASFEYTIKKD